MKMQTHLVCIINGAVLLIQEKNQWSLPGGNPGQAEDCEVCLLRAVRDKFPEVKISLDHEYGIFEGASMPHDDPLVSKVFFGKVENDTHFLAEMEGVKLFNRNQLYSLPFTDITKKIVGQLIANNYL